MAAWADPEIQRWTGVPERRDLAAAERWIAGDEARRERWLSLDLVVDLGGAVAGEVGLSAFDRAARDGRDRLVDRPRAPRARHRLDRGEPARGVGDRPARPERP